MELDGAVDMRTDRPRWPSGQRGQTSDLKKCYGLRSTHFLDPEVFLLAAAWDFAANDPLPVSLPAFACEL